jgi:hypothetical protein
MRALKQQQQEEKQQKAHRRVVVVKQTFTAPFSGKMRNV